MTSTRGLLALLLLTAFSAGTLRAADWPRYRGPNQDGISREKDWLGEWPGGQPRRVWKANVGTGFSSVAVVGGRVYTVGSDGRKKGGKDTVYCLDEATGATAWTFEYAQDLDPKYYEGGPGATPTVADGKVYVVGRHGWVHCLDAADGHKVWARNLSTELGLAIPDWGFNSSVHLEDGLAVINAGDHGVALDKATGREAWVSGKLECGYGTPVPFERDGRRALAMFTAMQVVAVDPKTGQVLWRLPWKTDWNVNASDPVVVGNRLWVSSGYGTGGAAYDISGAKPRQLWTNKEIRAHMASSVVMGGFVYGVDAQGGDKDSRLKCLDLETGAVRWASPKAETGNLSATADGRLLWLTGGGELVVVDARPEAYHEVVRAQVNGGKHWSPPVLANGRVYVRNARGELVCLDVRGPKAG